MKNFESIDLAKLDNVTGGAGAGPAFKKAAGWAWRNVIAPAGGGALYDWASRKFGGGGEQPAQPAQPAQPTPPAQ